jgi:hypothetical protein
LAESELLSGKLDRTLEFYREAAVALGNPPRDTRKNAMFLGTYGVKLAMADDLVQARAQFRKSIDMYTRLGRENSADALATLGQMAYCTAPRRPGWCKDLTKCSAASSST